MKAGVLHFRKNVVVLIATVCTLLVFSACKKDYQNSPYSEVESFTIQDTAGTILNASITDDAIIIYWPSYQAMPDSITPVIRVSKSATVQPASGVKVAFDSSTVYKVTAQDGTQTIYRLAIPNNQPIPYITSFTSVTYKNMKLARVLTTSINMGGNYFIPDTTQTHVFLKMTSDGSEKPVAITSLLKTTIILEPLAKFNLTEGTSFHFKVVTGNRSTLSTDALIVASPVPSITVPTAATTVKSGETFTFTGVNATYVSGAGIGATSSSTTLYPLEVVSSTTTTVTFKIPASVPLGEYRRFTFTYSAGTYHDAGTANVNINAATRSIKVVAP